MLHNLSPLPGSRKKRTRVGRGNSAGRGTTTGKGTKGQRSRAGRTRRFAYEGGQTPLLMRQPKLGGFRNPNKVDYEVINLDTLEEKLPAGSYDVAKLAEKKLVHGKKPVKVLGRGEVKKKFTLSVHAASTLARDAVTKAGGSITIVSAK